jgi:hypothetical protein
MQDFSLQDLALQVAGVSAILIAIAHGVIAERRVFPEARIEPSWARRLLRMVWQASTVDWIAMGVLLVVAPTLGSQAARQWIVAAAVVVLGYATVGNAIVTRGRHVGCWAMAGVVALALLGC